MKIEIFKRFSVRRMKWQWYFRFRSLNGEIVTPSEGYSNRLDMLATLHLIRMGASTAEIVDLTKVI